jgi:alpha-aminoadipate carrier protein LysW
VEVDLDEDEVEEGEILSCPECEAELEVVQTHPVHVNVISDEDDEDEPGDDDDKAAADVLEAEEEDVE